MPIEIVLADALAAHEGNCPNIEAVDERLKTVEGEVVIARFAGYTMTKVGDNYQIILSFTGDTTEDYIFTQGTDYVAVSGTYVTKSSITTYTVTVTPVQVAAGELLEMKRVIDVAIMYQIIVDAAFIGAGGGTGGPESDPIWTADKPNYATMASVTQSITAHDIDESAHGYLVGKVETLQSVVPGTATPTNKLITASDLQTGLNGVYVPGAMIYRGILANEAAITALPSPAAGDYYQAADTGSFYIYNGTVWQETSGLTEFDGYTKPEVDDMIDNVSADFETEVQAIFDRFASAGGITSDWIPACGSAPYPDEATVILSSELQNSNEIMIVGFETAYNQFNTMVIPTKIITPYEGVDVRNLVDGTSNAFVFIGFDSIEADGTSAQVTFRFESWTRMKITSATEARILRVYYRNIQAPGKPQIQYYKDPAIIGGNSPDYEKQEAIINALTNTPYIPTITNTSSTFTGTGAPYSVVKDGYYDVYVRFDLGTALDSSTQDGCIMLGLYVNGVQKSFSLPTAVSEGGKRYRWTVSAECHAGDEIQVYVRVEDAQNVDVEGYTTTWFYTPYRSNVLQATEAAFNQHTQNLDIHVTADEKSSIGTIPAFTDGLAAISTSLGTTTANLATLNATVNDKHIPTDRYRWQDFYATQLELYEQIAASQGLKPDPDNATEIPQGTPYTVSAPQGGLLEVRALNTGGFYTAVAVLGQPSWNSSGLIEDVSVTKYFRLLNSDQAQVDNAQSALFTPAIEDPDNPTRIAMAKMQDEIAANKIMILDIQAGIQNKKPSGVKQDINGQTFTVTNELGGRITGKGLNLLLGSTGVVTVANAQGTTEVYNNAGLLSLLDPVPVLVKDVARGDIVTSSGMGELSYEDYIAG